MEKSSTCFHLSMQLQVSDAAVHVTILYEACISRLNHLLAVPTTTSFAFSIRLAVG